MAYIWPEKMEDKLKDWFCRGFRKI